MQVVPDKINLNDYPADSAEADRIDDCRAAVARSRMQCLRWYRDGEIVWVKVPSSFLGQMIDFWPGVIDKYRVKSIAHRYSSKQALGETGTASIAQAQAPRKAAEEIAPWEVEQWTEYTVQLLGVNRTVNISDQHIIPYILHRPSNRPDYWDAMRTILGSLEKIDWDVCTNFDPIADAENVSDEDQRAALRAASAPFSYGVCVAAHLAVHWTPTHPFNIDSKGKGKGPALHLPGLDLAPNCKRTEWQGLWWGAERIWSDDLVRLKPCRKEYAPSGGNNILEAAPPGKKAMAAIISRFGIVPKDKLQNEFGAGQRGLFLQIRSIFSIDPPPETKMASEMFLSGMLYELADEDWEDLSNEPQAQPDSTLSHPIFAHPPPLPEAPTGFRFRPILRAGFDAIVPVGLVAGRYYARIHNHPLLQPQIDDVLLEAKEALDTTKVAQSHLLALLGYIGGLYNAVDPSIWHESRSEIKKIEIVRQRDCVEDVWKSQRNGASISVRRPRQPPPPGAEVMEID
jgi:hypothetical protein